MRNYLWCLKVKGTTSIVYSNFASNELLREVEVDKSDLLLQSCLRHQNILWFYVKMDYVLIMYVA